MKSSATLLTAALAANASAGTTCCHRLSRVLHGKVGYPGESRYGLTEAAYWSLQESDIRPACIVYPTSAVDVAQAVSIIGTVSGCEFAVKARGHNPAAGFANVQHGVTIDMAALASVVVSHDRSVVKVVLADGRLVQANATSHPDLYHALKGGANNFGVVTRFDLAPFAQGNISVTTLANDISKREAVFEAFTGITAAPEFDVSASLVTALLFSSATKTWQLSSSAVYARPDLHQEVFANLSAIPSVSNSSSVTSLSAFADESPTPPLNWLFATVTLKPSARLMMDVFDVLNDTLYTFNPAGGVTWSIAFEPLAGALISPSRSNGGDVLGVGPDNNGFIVLVSALWPNSTMNRAVEQVGRRAVHQMQSRARSKGLLQDFQYLNYAAPYQRPLDSYGKANLDFLKRVSTEYDPNRVFQDRVKGGFKL